METNCLYCNISFKKRRKTNVYCCRSCQTFHLRSIKKIPDRIRKGKYLNCLVCQKDFYVRKYRIAKGNAKYCSRSCLAKDKLSKYVKIYGFKKLGKPPRKYKYININGKQYREHRWIMEKNLGRKLERWEHVHHINGDCSDNDLKNLVVLSSSEHPRIEMLERKKIIVSS